MILNQVWNSVMKIFVLFAGMLLIAGCSGGVSTIQLVEVKGTVQFNGAPLPNATVCFIPETGPMATGITGADGAGATPASE
jgi:hypothetical protein